MSDPRIVIVGAGPAGMEAALTLVRSGLRPIVIDAAACSGGQIYRRPPASHKRSYHAIYGADAQTAKRLHNAFDAACDKMDYRPKTRVWGAHDGTLFLDGPDGRTTLLYNKLILCTGATDRVYPVPGWEAPGCYSLGGAQIALKSQALALGDPIGFVGAGPLLWFVAWQHLKAGAQVAGVWCTARRTDLFGALPWLALRPRLAMRGARQIFALWRAGVALHFNAGPLAVTADANGDVAGLQHAAGRQTPLRALALGWHLRSEAQLARLLDLPTAKTGHHPATDRIGRSAVPGIYLAGDGVEVLGADAARIGGRMAATAVLVDLGQAQTHLAKLRSLIDRMKHARLRAFAKGLARAFPPPAPQSLLSLPDDTILCRCEGVSLAAVRAVSKSGRCDDLNRIKALTRAGMGRCQGRYCGATLTAIVAGETGQDQSQIPPPRPQAPLYPLPFSKVDR